MDANKIKQMNEELLKSDTNIFQLYKVSRVIPFSKENKISIERWIRKFEQLL